MMAARKDLPTEGNILSKYSELHDLLTDALAYFEDLYYEINDAMNDISDSVESARRMMNDIDSAMRRIQCRRRIKERKHIHIPISMEPSEPFAPPYPPEEDDKFYLPFPEEDSDE